MIYQRIIILGSALWLGSCGYQPLYGTSDSGTQVSIRLGSVIVEQQNTRTGQLIRNEIVSSIGTGQTNANSSYKLSISPTSNDQNTSRSFNSDTTRSSYQLNVSYTLSDTASGKVVHKGSTFAHVSYDQTTAAFSDYQARINAEERAAKEVGGDIHARLAAYFASN